MDLTNLRLFTTLLLVALLGCGPAAAEARPNFIVILCDDLGYGDVGAYGAEDIETPHIDQLAAGGMTFTDFHAASSVCSPSRAALLTGRYPQRTGVYFVIDPRTRSTRRGLREDLPTLASLLGEAGYATACIGKWHLGHEPAFLPMARGFDTFRGILLSHDMPPTGSLRLADDAELHGLTRDAVRHAKPGLVPWVHGEEVVEFPVAHETLTRRCTRESLAFIEANRDRPFFLYLSHPMPHLPLAASEAFRASGGRGLYGDAVRELDWSVGTILGALERHGIADRTLVLFTSDNGPRLREDEPAGSAGPLRGGKAGPYEGGQRVPGIFRLPGLIPPGSRCDKLATMMDLMPTFAHLAGVAAPPGLDGHDISALLRGDPAAPSPYEAVFIEGTVRRGPWKLILQPDGTTELYSLHADLSEQHDLAHQMPQRVHELRGLMPHDLVRPPRLPIAADTAHR